MLWRRKPKFHYSLDYSASEEEDHIPLESLLISNRNSIRTALEEEAQIPLQSSLISNRNSLQYGNHKLIIKKSGAKEKLIFWEHPEDMRPPPFFHVWKHPKDMRPPPK
jgi:hypothetical protein